MLDDATRGGHPDCCSLGHAGKRFKLHLSQQDRQIVVGLQNQRADHTRWLPLRTNRSERNPLVLRNIFTCSSRAMLRQRKHAPPEETGVRSIRLAYDTVIRQSIGSLRRRTKLQLPKLCIGDHKKAAVEYAESVGLADEWYPGWDPLEIPDLDGIVSPANTIGEMSGGYDLALRTAYQRQRIFVQPIVQKSILDAPIYLGDARAIRVGGRIPWLIVVPTVLGKNDSYGKMQSTTPSADFISKSTYHLMVAAMQNSISRVGTVLLGAGVGGLNYIASVNAMANGYFQFLDEFQ